MDSKLTMDKTAFGSHIKAARKNKKMTAEQLSEHLNLSPKSIWQIEAGKRATSMPVFIKLCNTLDTSADFFLAQDLELSSNDNQYNRLFKSIVDLSPDEIEFVEGVIKLLIEKRNKK